MHLKYWQYITFIVWYGVLVVEYLSFIINKFNQLLKIHFPTLLSQEVNVCSTIWSILKHNKASFLGQQKSHNFNLIKMLSSSNFLSQQSIQSNIRMSLNSWLILKNLLSWQGNQVLESQSLLENYFQIWNKEKESQQFSLIFQHKLKQNKCNLRLKANS